MDETIKTGDYVLIQRQDYMRLHRVKERSSVKLGQHLINLDAIIGEPYMQHFQMQPTGNNTYKLEKISRLQDISSVIDVRESGRDNRHIVDDGTSQGLSKQEIEQLRDVNSTAEILEKLVSNSKTFDKKTEYSQEKYLKKKQKKYYGYITIRRPTVRLMAKIFFKQQEATLSLRIDDLAQIMSYANVQSGGRFILFDSGTKGLLPAAIMQRIGPDNDGQLVYLYPGNDNQRGALQALHLPEEHNNRCIPVNIHSALRWLHQNKTVDGEYVLAEKQQQEFDASAANVTLGKRKHENNEGGNGGDGNGSAEKRPKRPQWHYQCHAAAAILRDGVDGIIIASREHPLSIVQEIIGFLKPSRSFVIYNALREPLQDLYFALVGRRDVTNVKLTCNFMRDYQVLPERTHPLVNMTTGGYLLTGVKLISL